jgi:hypothetical protein
MAISRRSNTTPKPGTDGFKITKSAFTIKFLPRQLTLFDNLYGWSRSGRIWKKL